MTEWVVTGAAGFIGAHVCRELVREGCSVLGIDNLNDYYSVALKRARVHELIRSLPGSDDLFRFRKLDLRDADAIRRVFDEARPSRVVHLAAQAGVRYGLEAPFEYLSSNLTGFGHVLEACRTGIEQGWLEHLVYASSSSVYGNDHRLPFSEHATADHPVSLYAATKRGDELLAHSYSSVFGLPTTGLRFFTVYGPWGRPDMAYWSFTEAILRGQPIPVFGDGSAVRDFTYVDDVTRAVLAVARTTARSDERWSPTAPDPASSDAPWRILNVGLGRGSTVEQLISLLEQDLHRTAVRRYVSAPRGDVVATSARVDDLESLIGFRPGTSLEVGLRRFVDWYRVHIIGEPLVVLDPDVPDAISAAGAT
jgi:UDP-glucuronate 4-epimerase